MRKQKILQMHFEFAYFYFVLIHLELKTINTFIDSRSSLKNHTRLQTKMDKVFTRFQTKTAHTYIAYIREYSTPRDECKR